MKKRKKKSGIGKVLFLGIFVFMVTFMFTKVSQKISIDEIPRIFTSELNKKNIDFMDINVDSINSTGFLELVNKDYNINLDKNYNVVSAYQTVPLSNSDIELDSTVLKSLKNFMDDANKSGYYNLFINSGYRTYEKQKLLYDNSTDKSFVQTPNYSEHQTGLAVDIAINGVSGEKMGETKEGKWLAKNAWKYGFILRYAEDKIHITNISYEPWHFRYLGLPHAAYCYQNNLSLEEYIDFLKANGSYSMDLDGKHYEVFYKVPVNGIIQVPSNMEFDISADNTGGYIITVEV